MTPYLLDTNILVRAADTTSAQQQQANNAVSNLMAAGNEVFLTAQVLIEFWAVATRPATSNGLGWTVSHTDHYVQQLLNRFLFLDDTLAVFNYWRYLVRTHQIEGKHVHDARVVAVMLAHGVTHFLTFDADDFRVFPGITVVHPDSVT